MDRPRSVLRSRLAVSVPAISVLALLAVTPVGATADATPVTPASVNLSSGELANIDASALGLESSQLASALVKIPALSTLPTGTLDSLIAGLPTNSTLRQLLAEVKSATGVEVSTGEAVGVVLGDAATNPDALSHLLGTVTSLLNSTPQAGALASVLTNLIGGLTPTQLQQLESQLGATGSPAELADVLQSKLANGELESELSTVLGELGTTAATTGSQAATTAGTTAAELASELGVGEEDLKAASGTSTPLGSLGGYLDALAGPSGLTLGTVPSTPAGTTTTNGGSTTTSTTGNTSTSTSTAPGVATPAKSPTGPGKVKIVSHKVKGHTLVLVVRVPSAGELTVTGAHAKRELKKSKGAATLTLRIPLSNAAVADVRRKHKLKLQLKAAFKPVSGAASAASATFDVR